MRPPTLTEARTRGLLVKYPGGVHTFSNGTEHELWADVNCWECAYYDADSAGLLCAFEGAALLACASPDLVRMFGWLEHPDYPGEFEPPQQCAFFRSKRGDDGSDNPPPPDPDPRQLVLIADPTEVIAGVLPAVEVAVTV